MTTPVAPISIRELQRDASAAPRAATLHLQLDQATAKETRQGKTYIELGLTDGTDVLTIRVWSEHPMFSRAQALKPPQFLRIDGQWIKGSYGVEPQHWSMENLADADREALLQGPPAVREKQATDLAYIRNTVSDLADPRLRALGQRFLEAHEERFLRTAAARRNHHARRGGLVEHVAQMMRAVVALSGVYEDMNADLLVSGVLFHDCGKLWENCYQPTGFTMPHHEAGELLGHISLGIELVNHLWRELGDAPEAAAWVDLEPRTEDVRLHLLHLIASHHGTHEFGSPVLPKTPEAILLHFVDNIDAKLEMYHEGYETSSLLGKNIFERRRPVFHPLVRPLPRFTTPQDSDEAAATVATEPPDTADADRDTDLDAHGDGAKEP